MMPDNIYLALGITSLTLGLILLITLIFISNKTNVKVLSRDKRNRKSSSISLRLYGSLSKRPLLKSLIRSIRTRFDLLYTLSESEIRKKTILMLIFTIVFIGLLVLIVAISTRSLTSVLFVFIILIFSADSLIDMFVIKLNLKIMTHQVTFNNRVRHYFYETRDVVEAVYEACDELFDSHKEIALQGMKMYDAITSSKREEAIEAYRQTAPNRFLKIFIALLYSTSEFGDREIDGQSSFTKSLSLLNEEIRLEIAKRNSIAYYFRSLNLICLVPLLFMSPLRNWASSNFYSLELFYHSSFGKYLEISMYVITLLSYSLVRSLQQTDQDQMTRFRHINEQSRIFKFISNFMPIRATRKYESKMDLIKKSAANISMAYFYLSKLVIAFLVFTLSLIFFIGLHHEEREALLTGNYQVSEDKSFLGGRPSDEDLRNYQAQAKYDSEIMIYHLSQPKGSNLESSIKSLKGDETVIDQQLLMRLEGKILAYKSAYLKWYELIACILLSFTSYHLYDLILAYKRHVMKVEADNEVSMYLSLILMLHQQDRMSVIDLIYFMSDYANIYREDIEKCLSNYDAGPEEALEDLYEEIRHQKFKEVISSFLSSIRGLSISEAFEEISAEKAYFFKEREEQNLRSITSKKNSGNLVGFLPTYALIVLYFGLPLIYVSINEINLFYETL